MKATLIHWKGRRLADMTRDELLQVIQEIVQDWYTPGSGVARAQLEHFDSVFETHGRNS